MERFAVLPGSRPGGEHACGGSHAWHQPVDRSPATDGAGIIGRKLVKRSPTGYELTELGVCLLVDAERVEDAIAAFERRAEAADQNLTGSVRVTCSSTMADRLARSSLIRSFHSRLSGTSRRVRLTDRYLDLSKGEADIAIRTGAAADETLIRRKVAEVPWAVYATRGYVERHGCPKAPDDIVDGAPLRQGTLRPP